MSDELARLRAIITESYQQETHQPGHMGHVDDPETAARLIRHMFGTSSGVDKHVLRDALLGHKNDPKWAMSVLDHLSQ